MTGQLLLELDQWSNKAINTSFIGFLIKKIFDVRFENQVISSVLKNILFVLIGGVFVSLCLPQFANDRLGIGAVILSAFIIFILNVFLGKNDFKLFNLNLLDFLILCFLMCLTLSTFNSYFLEESLTGFLKYFIFIIFYFILKFTLLNSTSDVPKKIFTLLVLCGSIVSIYGVYQYITHVEPLATWEDPTLETTHTRVYSTLGNPNLLAGYLILLLPLNFILAFGKNCSNLNRFIFISGGLVTFFCILFTGSRGGYIGLVTEIFAALTISFVFMYKKLVSTKLHISKFLLLPVFLIFLILAVTFMFPMFKERLLTILFLREHSSNNYRINVWLSCLKMLKDNWIFGIGPGNHTFMLAYGLYMKSSFDALAAYNVFLEIALECGFIGCLLFLGILFISFTKLHYLFCKNNNLLALGIFISLIGVLTHGLVDTVFFRPQVFIPFWFLLASIDKLEDAGLSELEN